MLFKHLEPKQLPLTHHERFVSAQVKSPDEGVIAYLLEQIPAQNNFCIEFGARDGLTAHTRFLIEQHDFGALYLEGDEDAAERLGRNFADNAAVKTGHAFITRDNIEAYFAEHGVPHNPFILMIDMDGNDYYVWEAIKNYQPQVVCIEYNPSFPPPSHFVIDYQEDFLWSGDDYYGASISALVELGKAKGYELVHCTSGGDNLFFVMKEYFDRFGIRDNSPEAFYQLPQYGKNGRAPNGKGHPISKKNSTFTQRLKARLRYRLYSLPRKRIKRRMKREVMQRSSV